MFYINLYNLFRKDLPLCLIYDGSVFIINEQGLIEYIKWSKCDFACTSDIDAMVIRVSRS